MKVKLSTRNANAEINKANKLELINIRLSSLAYFSPLEGNGVKIPMLFNSISNDELRKIMAEELAEIRKAEKSGNKIVLTPHRSRDIIALNCVPHTNEANLERLFNEKFEDSKYRGYSDPKIFAAHELNYVNWAFKDAFQWFPIFEQWRKFLSDVSDGKIILKTDKPQENKTEDYDSSIFTSQRGEKIFKNYCEQLIESNTPSPVTPISALFFLLKEDDFIYDVKQHVFINRVVRPIFPEFNREGLYANRKSKKIEEMYDLAKSSTA